MKINGWGAGGGVAAGIGGCASAPAGPSVKGLPGRNKTMEQFQAEDARCRQAATGELERDKGGQVSAQKRYDMAYMQCMYAQGNQIPVVNRPGYSSPAGASPATKGTIGQPPTPPSGTPTTP